jgi:hypothetical protein
MECIILLPDTVHNVLNLSTDTGYQIHYFFGQISGSAAKTTLKLKTKNFIVTCCNTRKTIIA